MPYVSTVADLVPPPPMPTDRPTPIAPWWHTASLFALLCLSTFATHRSASAPVDSHIPRIAHYSASIVLEWILLGLVIAGVYRRHEFLRTAFRNRSRGVFASLGLGFAVYLAGTAAMIFAGAMLYFTPLFHHRNDAVIAALAPHTPREFAVWFFLSLSAGICEELIFRGYLIQQLTAWTRRPILAIVLASLLFGSVHLYEGLAAIVPLAALATVYGFVVRFFKGDLRAVIVAHTLQDFLVAFLLLARPYLEHYQPKP